MGYSVSQMCNFQMGGSHGSWVIVCWPHQLL